MFFTNVEVAPTANRFCFPIPLAGAEREHLFLLGWDGTDICSRSFVDKQQELVLKLKGSTMIS